MKITEVGKYYPPYKGGIENHLYSIANHLKKWVNKINVLVFNTGIFSKVEENNNLKITRCGKLFELLATPFSIRMFFEFMKDNSDIIHLHTPNPSAHLYYNLSLFFKKEKKHRLFITHHSDIVAQKLSYKLYKPLLRKLYSKADKIIVATKNHVKYSDILPEFMDKISIIPYGLDVNDFKTTPELKNRILKVKKFLDNKKIILFIGRLVYYKGVSYLIDSFNKLDQKDSVLVIIGNGPYFSTLKAQAMNNSDIIFMPEADDTQLKVFLNACDFFVLPSIEKSEAFGIVQLEAMACKKPVISTNLDSGVKSVNIHEKTGLKVAPKDSQELKDALKQLLNDDELRRRLGENAYNHIKENYSSEKCTYALYEQYKENIN